MYGIAAVMIVIFHMYNIIPKPYSIPHIPFDFSPVTDHFNFGVDVFLLLSGVSLYFSLIKKPELKDYAKARITRTLVPYLLLSFPYAIYCNLFQVFRCG